MGPAPRASLARAATPAMALPACARPAVARVRPAARRPVRRECDGLRNDAGVHRLRDWQSVRGVRRVGQPCCGTGNGGTCTAGLACGGRNAHRHAGHVRDLRWRGPAVLPDGRRRRGRRSSSDRVPDRAVLHRRGWRECCAAPAAELASRAVGPATTRRAARASACGGRNAGMGLPGMCAACGGAGQLCCPTNGERSTVALARGVCRDAGLPDLDDGQPVRGLWCRGPTVLRDGQQRNLHGGGAELHRPHGRHGCSGHLHGADDAGCRGG